MDRRVRLAVGVLLVASSAHGFIASPRARLSRTVRARRNAPRVSADATSDWDLELYSPAKINLFLRVMKRRDDGFHELASLFQTVALGDNLSFSLLPPSATQDQFECDIEGLPTDGSNLVIRAFDLFRLRSGSSQCFRCRLEKRTPIQAGLGGGSSNAAAALHAANLLCGEPASDAELIEWSGELGSDITFFLGESGSAYCTGRGEIIDPVQPLPTEELFIIKPAAGLSTPLVFKTLAASGYTSCSSADPKALLESFTSPSATPADMYINDLEPPAFECLPALDTIKAALLGQFGFPAAMMSGSGTSLFAMGDPQTCRVDEFADKLVASMAEQGISVRVWRTSFLARETDGARWYVDPHAAR